MPQTLEEMIPESDASITAKIECAVEGCVRQVATSLKAIELSKIDPDFSIHCFPRAHNIINSIICGNIYTNCTTRKVVMNGRCFIKISCPKCEAKPESRKCLKCNKKFKPGCKLTHVCSNCYLLNSKPGRNNGY